MKVSIQLFARARELAGADCIDVEVDPNSRLADVADALNAQVEALSNSGLPLLWAVNNDFAAMERPVAETDEIACFPPVSGG